jgi:hypothetical protein
MKKTIFVFSAIAIITATTLTNCNSPARKKVEAQTEEDANKNDFPRAKEEEYIADIDRFRKEIDDKITANKQSIAGLKSRLKDQKAASDYKKKIYDLAQKNNDIKKRMDEYTVEGKEKWDKFKTEINHDMDELTRSLNGLTNKRQ